METKFKHKTTGEIGYYKDGVFKSGRCCVEIGVPPSSEYWDEIFITEDGVELYKGDKYYAIYTFGSWNISGHYIFSINPEAFMYDNVKIFAEKNKAEEYVRLNQPKYSLKDIEDSMSDSLFNPMRKYVLSFLAAKKD